MVSCLPYGAENFLLHQGVKSAFETTLALTASRSYSIVWLSGALRSGKTHFSIKLYEELIKHNLFPHLIEGRDIAGFLTDRGTRGPFNGDEVFVFDDVQIYMEDGELEDSGPLVAFLELARMSRVPVLFISTLARNSLKCDEHIMSRLRSGHLVSLLNPSDGDMPSLIQAMGRQRGILLTDKRVRFIARRLRRDIPSVEEYLNKVTHLSTVLNKAVKLPLLSDAL